MSDTTVNSLLIISHYRNIVRNGMSALYSDHQPPSLPLASAMELIEILQFYICIECIYLV